MALPPVLRDRLRLPVICSPLFIISNPDLVIGQCKAGVVGSFPALNARPISMLDEWLHRITEELAAWDRDHPETPAALTRIALKAVVEPRVPQVVWYVDGVPFAMSDPDRPVYWPASRGAAGSPGSAARARRPKIEPAHPIPYAPRMKPAR